MDLSHTRFSGRLAPPHPGGFPNLPDHVTRESYSRECMSVGWWPGGGGTPISEPSFYAYAYPEPVGCPAARVSRRLVTILMRGGSSYEVVPPVVRSGTGVAEFAQST
jgi:hypothetical protein